MKLFHGRDWLKIIIFIVTFFSLLTKPECYVDSDKVQDLTFIGLHLNVVILHYNNLKPSCQFISDLK